MIEFLRLKDFKIFYYFYRLGIERPFLEFLYYLFARYGIVLFLLSFTYLIWRRRINAFLCSFIAMGLAGLFDLAIFAFWRRPRPFITHSNLILSEIERFNIERLSSFPSSHTYIAFAIATSIYLYGHKRLGSLLFIFAVLVAISRVGTGLHYPSDALAGAILGIASGAIAYRFVRKHEDKWEY